jgi:SnoaL-like protein
VNVEERIALRELVDRYASAVDGRRLDEVAGLFAEDGTLFVHGPTDEVEARRVYAGRSEIRRALDGLGRFRSTHHLVGGHLVSLDGDRMTGETYCQASHVYDTDEGPRIYVLTIRYQDTYVHDGRWRFAERRERVDWAEDRPFHPREV